MSGHRRAKGRQIFEKGFLKDAFLEYLWYAIALLAVGTLIVLIR